MTIVMPGVMVSGMARRPTNTASVAVALMTWLTSPAPVANALGPGPTQTPPPLVDRVVARLAGNDVGGAARALEALAPTHAPHDAVERLRLHVGARRGDGGAIAMALLKAVTRPDIASWLLLAASEGIEGHDAAAAALLANLVRGEDAAGRVARVSLARIFAAHGLKKRAVAELSAALGHPSGRLLNAPRDVLRWTRPLSDPAKETERGWLLYDAHASRSALYAFERALAARPDPEVRCWAMVGGARAALSQRDIAKGKAFVERAQADCPTHPELPEAVVRLARNAYVGGDTSAVMEAIEWSRKNAPEWTTQHGITALAPLSAPRGRDAKALTKSIRKRLKRARWFDPVGLEAMRHFKALRKRGKHARAAALLKPLADAGYRNWRPSLWGQLDYWAARAQWEIGEQDAAARRWQQVVERYPQSWYGLLAAARLRKDRPRALAAAKATLRESLDAMAAPPPAPISAPLRDRVQGLARWGLVKAIRHELQHARVLLRPDAAAWGARTLSRAGLPSAGARLGQRAVKLSRPGALARDPHGLWRAAWPTPYRATVERALDTTGASPWFVWAVMRVESLFAPTAVSHAGARGLLQLMPGTASWLRRRLKDLPLGDGDLFDPLDNILLGSAFLERLAHRYDGSKPLMLAAYNAGPGRLRSHIRRRHRRKQGTRDVAEFVDGLPWNETRHYVRSVVTSWATYRLLYGCRCLSYFDDVLPSEVVDTLTGKRKRKRKRRRRRRRR